MEPSILVLTDFSPAAERARAYAAALAAPLGAVVHLLKVNIPAPMNPEVGRVLYATNARYVQDDRHSLEQLAANLPGPATAELAETGWTEAVRHALDEHRPLLVVAGLTATTGLLDEWLSNRTLPLAHETGYPLLLVPQNLPDAALHPPRRLALAVEDAPFQLVRDATTITPLLDALAPEIVVVTVLSAEAAARDGAGHNGLRAARQCGLTRSIADSRPHQMISAQASSEHAAAGIRQAVAELPADLLVLLDPDHGWVHKLFRGSVIDQVLRQTTVPVLLLAARVGPLPEQG